MLESETIPKIVHDVKAFMVTTAGLGISPQNVAEDVMLYAFLLSADPGGCSPEALAYRYLDRKLNAAAEQQAEATLAVADLLTAQVGSTGIALGLRRDRPAACPGAGPDGADRHPG